MAKVACIFVLLLVGYATKKLRILSVKDTGVINSIVINLALPAFIFLSINDKPLTSSMLRAPVAGLAAECAILALAYWVSQLLKLDRKTTAGLMIAATFGNTGYLGLPFVTAAFSGDKVAIQSAVMMDSFAMRILLCTAGIAVATSFAGEKFKWRDTLEFVKSPLFAAVVLGLVFRTIPIKGVTYDVLKYVADLTVPLSMISVGLNLSMGSAKQWPLGVAAAVLFKIAALPVLTLLALPLLHVDHTVAKVAVLEMAMPSAIFGGVIAGRYGANKEFVAGAIFISTLLSVVAIPAVLTLVK
jgi:predicted permease